jgi:SAM-dependent methyltransferase
MERAVSDEVAQIKQAQRATWSAGDYPSIAQLIEDVPPRHLLDRMGVEPGMELLDVATGTGNLALKAAQAGARVTGLDLTPELLGTARGRADQLGVEVDWVEGDAEELPFDDGRFDRVASVFGVMFAPRHDVAARELVRVLKPGGAFGVVNWSPEGITGRMFQIIAGRMPPPPPPAQPPPLWGTEEHVRELFADAPVELEFERGSNPFLYDSFDAYMEFTERSLGPLVMARQALGDQWPEARAELEELMRESNLATDGSVRIEGEYLLTVGRRTG